MTLKKTRTKKEKKMEDEFNNLSQPEITENDIYNNPHIFKILSETSLAGFIIYDDKKLLYTNSYVQNLSGYSKEELVNMQLVDLIHPDFRKLVLQRASERLSGKNVPVHYEFIVKTKSGEEIWIDLSASTFSVHGKKLGIATLYDITERKKSVEVIRKTNEEWEKTFNSVEDIIFVMDENFRILKSNTAFKNIYCVKNQEMIGRKCYELVNGSKEICPNCVAIKSLHDKKSHVEEWEDQRTSHYYLVSISPLLDDMGNVKNFVHLARDITEIKYAEKKLIESLKIKTDFVSTVSHEFRTPLTAIKEGINLLLKNLGGTLEEADKDILDVIQRNIDRLDRQICNVLDFKKLEFGAIQFNMAKNDINEALIEVYRLMLPIANKKGLTVNLDLDKSLPQVELDWDRIIQVLNNLVNNSVKFTKEGNINIISRRFMDYVKIEIHDTGMGIKKEELSRIFQSFVQLGEPEIRKGGIGLGLAICKEIIEKHKGRIWAESDLREGTSFYFILPI